MLTGGFESVSVETRMPTLAAAAVTPPTAVETHQHWSSEHNVTLTDSFTVASIEPHWDLQALEHLQGPSHRSLPHLGVLYMGSIV